MKKVALTLASIAAIATFAPEASAVPVFARQTGMACLACHFQHFPLLNAFGRSFKASGFTMIGAQAKVEGDTEGIKLDIPDRLNLGLFTTTYWQNQGGLSGSQARWGVPASGGELSIFYGGRGSEYAGFLSELGTGGAGGAAATGAAKMALLFPVADMRAGLVAYTGGQGAAYGFEYLNTGAADTHKMMGNSGASKEHVAATYAGSYMGTRQDATGISLVANNALGFVSVGKYAAAGPGTSNANDLPLTYIRVAGLMDLAGWDTGFGIQRFSGDQSIITGSTVTYEATVLDAQLQGELAGMSTGLYVTYGTAPANVNGNAMSGGWSTLVKANGTATGVASTVDVAVTSLNVAASVEVHHGATVQVATRMANRTAAGGTALTDNAIMLGGTYDIAQNIALGLNYTMQSGTAWDAVAAPIAKDSTIVILEALF